MGEFVYVLRPTRAGMLSDGPTEEEAAIGERHLAYLQRLHAEGVVVMAGRTTTEDERVFGIVVLRAEDGEAAARIMRGDPGVAEGIMTGELSPFRVALG